jgi:Tfp pilus assembly protein PilF
VYQNKNRINLAIKEYQAASEAEPNFAPAETALGWILFEGGNKQEAMDRFNRALKGNPEDGQAYYGLARIYAERGKPETAVELYNKALKFERDPDKKNEMMPYVFKAGGSMDV